MDWILRNLPLFVILFVFISIVRAVMRARQQQEQNRGESNDSEQQRRIQEIQEQIRRKIAERRGETTPAPPRVDHPLPQQRREASTGTPPLDPFGGGGTLRRALEEVERRLQPAPPPLPPPVLTSPAHFNRAELERQVQLEEQLRVAAETRHNIKRRADHLASERDEVARSETGLLTSARARLLADLADPHSLSRAIVLREVLGPPVGLR